ncbi:tRNA (adenosine(37)-N6)-threonylcarbamoyltransferase complex transferase subunit TsaD [Candidatus Pacearchaeota archaeon]|nr:tRNA (adenosine(37)-N6)-threonylcarbamoyltransferase complex transferase subunit TsaD [Candidatus Pacearchaeota archaeon]
MIIGVESTAHTFGVGVCHKGKVLANVRDMYHPAIGGIIPIDAGKHHTAVAEKLWNQALRDAKITEKEIKGIAFSYAPGLAPCLLAGMHFVKAKAKLLGMPVIPVHHSIAHLEIGQSLGAKDPVLLYASGANTQIIAYAGQRYRIFGETLDVGIGNCLDKIARAMGFPFPGGPELEKLALKGMYHELKYSLKGMDVSFSGLQNQALQLRDKGMSPEDVACSVQETAFAMLVEASERALAHTGKKELVLGGGVACNARLQEMCRLMCTARGVALFCPGKPLLVDNGAMIAYTGELLYKKKLFISLDALDIAPRQRTDQVSVKWK